MKTKLSEQVKNFYIVDNVGIIKMKIDKVEDIISNYSNMYNYECLDPSVADYIATHAKYIDTKYPIRLEIYGNKLSDNDKQIIEEVIRDNYLYSFQKVEEKDNDRKKNLLLSVISMFIVYALYNIKGSLPTFLSIVGEIIPIAFSLFASSVITSTIVNGKDAKEEYDKANQFKNMDIVFKESTK